MLEKKKLKLSKETLHHLNPRSPHPEVTGCITNCNTCGCSLVSCNCSALRTHNPAHGNK